MNYKKTTKIYQSKCKEDSVEYEAVPAAELPDIEDNSGVLDNSTEERDIFENNPAIEVSLELDDQEYLSIEDDTEPPELSSEDVAAYILRKKGTMSTIKLQKLVYYCQAWSLVWDEAPLFKDRIEAWANGPVIPKLFYLHKGMFLINYNDFPYGNPDKPDENQKETINAVLDYYADKPAQWLVELSHLEAPWKQVRTGLPFGTPSNREIKQDEIAQYYSSLNEQEKESN